MERTLPTCQHVEELGYTIIFYFLIIIAEIVLNCRQSRFCKVRVEIIQGPMVLFSA